MSKNVSDEIFDASVRLVLEDFEKVDKHVIQSNVIQVSITISLPLPTPHTAYAQD